MPEASGEDIHTVIFHGGICTDIVSAAYLQLSYLNDKSEVNISPYKYICGLVSLSFSVHDATVFLSRKCTFNKQPSDTVA